MKILSLILLLGLILAACSTAYEPIDPVKLMETCDEPIQARFEDKFAASDWIEAHPDVFLIDGGSIAGWYIVLYCEDSN